MAFGSEARKAARTRAKAHTLGVCQQAILNAQGPWPWPQPKAQRSGFQSAKGKVQGYLKPAINLGRVETCGTPLLVAGVLGVAAAVGRP